MVITLTDNILFWILNNILIFFLHYISSSNTYSRIAHFSAFLMFQCTCVIGKFIRKQIHKSVQSKNKIIKNIKIMISISLSQSKHINWKIKVSNSILSMRSIVYVLQNQFTTSLHGKLFCLPCPWANANHFAFSLCVHLTAINVIISS